MKRSVNFIWAKSNVNTIVGSSQTLHSVKATANSFQPTICGVLTAFGIKVCWDYEFKIALASNATSWVDFAITPMLSKVRLNRKIPSIETDPTVSFIA